MPSPTSDVSSLSLPHSVVIAPAYQWGGGGVNGEDVKCMGVAFSDVFRL